MKADGAADVLFTDPIDPTWTIVDFAGKHLIFHTCMDHIGCNRIRGPDEISEDACGYCQEEPPPGFIALYKLYTWDKK
jgi:hypothetical protein